MRPILARASGIIFVALALHGCAANTATIETNRPSPIPLPTWPAPPTPAALHQPGATEMQTIMQLPDAILSVDVAANPTNGDAVVVAVAAPLTSEGSAHAFVRAYDGTSKTWGVTQNVDVGTAALGHHRFRSAAVAVTGDGDIFVVWGATEAPDYGLWMSTSRDNGATWDAPRHLADNVFGVLDLAATFDGQLAVLALGREPTVPLLLTRDQSGAWSAPGPIPVASAWYGTSGGTVIVGESSAARVVTATTGFRDIPGAVFLASRSLQGHEPWRVATRRVATTMGEGLLGRVRGITAALGEPNNPHNLVAFSFAPLDLPDAYAVASLDGGLEWGDITDITSGQSPASTAAPFGALAFDPAAGRLVALWTCCEDARWSAKASTHYAAWNVPGSAEWQRDADVPVITGAISAADSAFAQAPHARFAWLGWVEAGNTVAVRALDLGQLVASSEHRQPQAAPVQEAGRP